MASICHLRNIDPPGKIPYSSRARISAIGCEDKLCNRWKDHSNAHESRGGAYQVTCTSDCYIANIVIRIWFGSYLNVSAALIAKELENTRETISFGSEASQDTIISQLLLQILFRSRYQLSDRMTGDPISSLTASQGHASPCPLKVFGTHEYWK